MSTTRSNGSAPYAAIPQTARALRVPLAGSVPAEHAQLLVDMDLHCFALAGRWAGAVAIAGSEPVCALRAQDDPFAVLDHQPLVADSPEGFVGGGWFGFLGYGLSNRLEALDPPPVTAECLPEAVLTFHDHVLRLGDDGQWWFEALWTDARASFLEARLDVLRRRLAAGVRAGRSPAVTRWRPTPDLPGHALAVAACRERIRAGDLLQANIAMRLRARLADPLAELFARGVTTLRPDRAAFLAGPWGSLASFSPELLIERHGDQLRSAPIKGTRPRPQEPSAAEKRRAELAAAEKDRAENVMIVDLIRNDLGRVCAYGSVVVETLADARPHTGVWHLVSEVTGTRRPEVRDSELVAALFPPGSVTGAPKVAAMNVVSSLEGTTRQAFSGAIGFSSPVAGLELSVAIRTVESRHGDAWLDVGGGVVADSDPATEAEECLAKARPLVAALGGTLELSPLSRASGRDHPGPPRRPLRLGPRPQPRPDPRHGLLETVQVRDGLADDLAAHLTRLARSCEALFGMPLPEELDAAVIRAAGRCEGHFGLRVLLDADGGFEIRPRALPARHAPLVLEPVTLPGGIGAHKWRDRRLLRSIESAVAPSEPLLVDLDGLVLETSRASLVILKDGELITPPLDGRILPGTARARLLAQADAWGLATAERPLPLMEAVAGGAVFVCNALRGAEPVAALGPALPRSPTPEENALMHSLSRSPLPSHTD